MKLKGPPHRGFTRYRETTVEFVVGVGAASKTDEGMTCQGTI